MSHSSFFFCHGHLSLFSVIDCGIPIMLQHDMDKQGKMLKLLHYYKAQCVQGIQTTNAVLLAKRQ